MYNMDGLYKIINRTLDYLQNEHLLIYGIDNKQKTKINIGYKNTKFNVNDYVYMYDWYLYKIDKEYIKEYEEC